MPSTTIKRAHDMKFPVMVLISSFWIQNQIHMGIFRVTKLLDVAIPVLYADEKFLDVISRRIGPENLIGHIEPQNSIVNKGSHLRSYIHTAIAGAILRRHQLSALCGRRACEKKQERHNADYGCEYPLFHNVSLLPRDW